VTRFALLQGLTRCESIIEILQNIKLRIKKNRFLFLAIWLALSCAVGASAGRRERNVGSVVVYRVACGAIRSVVSEMSEWLTALAIRWGVNFENGALVQQHAAVAERMRSDCGTAAELRKIHTPITELLGGNRQMIFILCLFGN
jgi:hypothetical protein